VIRCRTVSNAYRTANPLSYRTFVKAGPQQTAIKVSMHAIRRDPLPNENNVEAQLTLYRASMVNQRHLLIKVTLIGFIAMKNWICSNERLR
jgi:hypothetical protein